MKENMEELVCKRKKFMGKNQTIIEGKVLIANSDLKKVEKIFCRTYVASCETEKGVVKVSGKANFVAIYETTEGEIREATFDTEFTSKVENAEINAGDACLVNVSVVETDITSISSGDIKIAAVIDVFASTVSEHTISYVKDSNDCACKKNAETVNYLSGVYKHTIKTTFDVETKDAISEVLLASVTALPRNVSANGELVKLDGEMSVNLVYAGGEYPYVKTVSECVQISEELDHKASEGNVIEAELEVKEISTSVNDGTVTFVVELGVTLLEYASVTIETVSDAFSTTNDVNLTIENHTCEEALTPQLFDEKINATAEVKNNGDEQIDKVVGASVKNLMVSNVYASDDETVVVEGLATITVFMAVSEEENKDLSSIDVEVPFSIKNRFDGVTSDSLIDANVVLCDVYAKHKRLSEIEVYGVIKICVNARNKQNVVVVSDLQIGELKTLNSNALSFIITNKAFEMFELAKNLNVTEEQLLAQNPELRELMAQSSVIPENTEIIVYRRKA